MQRPLAVDGERAAVEQHLRAGAASARTGGSTAPDQEPAAVQPGERREALPPGGEEDPLAQRRQHGRGGGGEIRHACQSSPGAGAPAGPAEHEQRHAGRRGAAARRARSSSPRTGGWRRRPRRCRCPRSQAASPSAPPKPPIRTSPAGSRGRRARPASETDHGQPGVGERRRQRPRLGGAAEDQSTAQVAASGRPSRGGCPGTARRSAPRPPRSRRGAPDARPRATCAGDVGERAADDQLVGRGWRGRPPRPGSPRRRCRISSRDHRVDPLHGQVQHHRAAGSRRSVARSSPGGIAVARSAVRVRMTSGPPPGTVSSRPSAAAAAAKAGTPGAQSYGTPAASSRRICSATALNTDGSPECSRATSRPGRVRRDHLGDDLVEGQVRGVDQAGARRARVQHLRPGPGCPAYRQTGDAAIRSLRPQRDADRRRPGRRR